MLGTLDSGVTETLFLPSKTGVGRLSVKGQGANISGFVGYTNQLYHYITKVHYRTLPPYVNE